MQDKTVFVLQTSLFAYCDKYTPNFVLVKDSRKKLPQITKKGQGQVNELAALLSQKQNFLSVIFGMPSFQIHNKDVDGDLII